MRLLIVIIAFLGLICGSCYIVFDPKFASYCVGIGTLLTFLTAFYNYSQGEKKEKIQQSQKLKQNSCGIQVGGDFNINKEKSK